MSALFASGWHFTAKVDLELGLASEDTFFPSLFSKDGLLNCVYHYRGEG